jgi:hypothetical protein
MAERECACQCAGLSRARGTTLPPLRALRQRNRRWSVGVPAVCAARIVRRHVDRMPAYGHPGRSAAIGPGTPPAAAAGRYQPVNFARALRRLAHYEDGDSGRTTRGGRRKGRTGRCRGSPKNRVSGDLRSVRSSSVRAGECQIPPAAAVRQSAEASERQRKGVGLPEVGVETVLQDIDFASQTAR